MKTILKITIYISLIFIFTQCISNDREGCDGYPELINPIPDTTTALSKDTLLIDLSGSNQSVFRHSNDKKMSMNFTISGSMSATVKYKDGNPDLGWEAVVILKETGTFQATVFAKDDCDFQERDDFTLTITNE